MSEFHISIPGGQSRKLLTGGKYCPENIIVEAKKPDPVEEKDVNFWDYDGTLLYSYTLDEAQTLAELPPPPVPKYGFLMFTNWNWSLNNIKAYGKSVDIGAIYATTDESSYFFMEIDSDTIRKQTLYFIQTVSAGVTIDWGDGSASETVSGTGTVSVAHEYAGKGHYVIKLSVTEGTVTLGWNDIVYSILGDDSGKDRAAKARLKKAFIGRSVVLGQYAFWGCTGLVEVSVPEAATLSSAPFNTCRTLEHLNLPRSVAQIPDRLCRDAAVRVISPGDKVVRAAGNMLLGCTALRRGVAVPDVTSLEYGTYYGCYSITKIDLGEKITTISGAAMYNCQNVVELTIPTPVSSIASGALKGMAGLRVLRFLPTTPPAVANADAFDAISADCVVEVPADSLSAYQNETNYASLAAQMVGV